MTPLYLAPARYRAASPDDRRSLVELCAGRVVTSLRAGGGLDASMDGLAALVDFVEWAMSAPELVDGALVDELVAATEEWAARAGEPTRAELEAIEAEWPLIASEIAVVDAQCRAALSEPGEIGRAVRLARTGLARVVAAGPQAKKVGATSKGGK